MKIQFIKLDLSKYNLTISYLKKFIFCNKLSFTALTGENLITLVTIISTEYTYLITLFKIFIMKIEYNNLYTHFILITQHRTPCIPELNRERIEKYITGIVNNNASKLYSIYANPEHVHFLISQTPKISVESIASIIADSSAKFINDNKLCEGYFCWQDSASAFSVSKSEIDKVCKYILNQHEHHRKNTFKEEYDELIRYYQRGVKWEIR